MFKTLISIVTLCFMGLAAHAEIVNISYSEDFTETLVEDYGEKEGEYLTKTIRGHVDKILGDTDTSAVKSIDIVIVDAKPNRPTSKQLSDTMGLSTKSFSVGGLSLEANITFSDGSDDLNIDYAWYERDIRQASASGTWSDARKTSRRFSKKLKKALISGSTA